MKSRRAQGISINMIIVAAIALIVLVVLVAIFTGRMGDFGRRITGEQNKYCGAVPSTEAGVSTSVNGVERPEGVGCGDMRQIYGVFKDISYGEVCCVPS